MLVFKKKETKTCRGLEFRIDAFGIYFLASEGEDLCAGISYQYPAWFSELFAEPNEYYVRNSFSYFNWGSPMISTDDIEAMRPDITAEMFKAAMGYEPQDDDLQRCNCALAGELSHSQCGWNWDYNKPQFMFGPVISSRGDSNADRKR